MKLILCRRKLEVYNWRKITLIRRRRAYFYVGKTHAMFLCVQHQTESVRQILVDKKCAVFQGLFSSLIFSF